MKESEVGGEKEEARPYTHSSFFKVSDYAADTRLQRAVPV